MLWPALGLDESGFKFVICRFYYRYTALQYILCTTTGIWQMLFDIAVYCCYLPKLTATVVKLMVKAKKANFIIITVCKRQLYFTPYIPIIMV